MQKIQNEINIMKTIDHPNIIKFEETVELKMGNHETYIIIIMEYCEYGDLCSFLNHNSFESENQKLKIMKGLLESIKYLHDRGIAHGDIKLENILLDSNFNPKLADFGFSKNKLIMGDNSKTGTIYYAAPELFKRGNYNTLKADIWSIGITLFCISQKCFPFKNGDVKCIINQIVSGNLSFEQISSKNLRKIIEMCTEVDPQKRPTIDELLNDEYFSYTNQLEEKSTVDVFDSEVLD